MRPAGMSDRCASFAPAKSAAAPFGQAATQAPQPMQAAKSSARSACRCPWATSSASGAVPAATSTVPPTRMSSSSAVRSTTRSRMTGNAADLHGSSRKRVTPGKARRC